MVNVPTADNITKIYARFVPQAEQYQHQQPHPVCQSGEPQLEGDLHNSLAELNMPQVLAESGGGKATRIRGRGPLHKVPQKAPHQAEEVDDPLQQSGWHISQRRNSSRSQSHVQGSRWDSCVPRCAAKCRWHV